jgi:hypothetical protein
VLKENRTVRPKKQVDNVNEDNKEIQEERNKVCHLCNRELPIFFYGNEEQIKDSFNSQYKLNSHAFMSMYTADKLGESIPNTPNWLNQVFGSLDSSK